MLMIHLLVLCTLMQDDHEYIKFCTKKNKNLNRYGYRQPTKGKNNNKKKNRTIF